MKPAFRTSTLFALILTVCLTACSNEYMDMSTAFRSELCVVKSNVGKSVSLLTDRGSELNPISALDSVLVKPGSRYLVTYIVLDSSTLSLSNQALGNYSVRVKDMQSVLVKPMLRKDQLTSPVHGVDPVKVLSQPWLGGGFLNMELMLKYENTDIKHSLWMIVDTTFTENGSLNTYLTFLHNANSDGQTKSASTLVSFDCADLPYRDESDSLIIHVQEWDANNHSVAKEFRILNTAK